MMNLLQETLSKLAEIEKTPAAIVHIGDQSGLYCSWDEFCVIANIEYDNGFGSAEIAEDLVIVFNDNTWLSREEYDGSEWWRYHKPPTMLQTEKFTKVKYTDYNYNLRDLNK